MAPCVTSHDVLTATLLAAKPGKEGLVGMSQDLLCTLPRYIGGQGEKLVSEENYSCNRQNRSLLISYSLAPALLPHSGVSCGASKSHSTNAVPAHLSMAATDHVQQLKGEESTVVRNVLVNACSKIASTHYERAAVYPSATPPQGS